MKAGRVIVGGVVWIEGNRAAYLVLGDSEGAVYRAKSSSSYKNRTAFQHVYSIDYCVTGSAAYRN